MTLPVSCCTCVRNKRKKRSNPLSLSSYPPPFLALFASFAVHSSGEPPFRRSTPCILVLHPLRPAGLQKEREGPPYALGAHVALEEVGNVGPAHAVCANTFESRVDGVGYRISRGFSEDVAGAVFRV